MRKDYHCRLAGECKLTTMAVMSSLDRLTLCHIYVDIFISLSQAKSRSYCRKNGIVKVITSSFYRYYQIPSDAITINLSYYVMSNSFT